MRVESTLERGEQEARTGTRERESNGSIREQAGALADVTLALQESEDRFLRLMRGAKDYALYMLDASGNIASWNAGAELLEGYKAEEIVGKHLSTLYETAERARAFKNLETAALVGRAEDEGLRVRRDGSTFWASVVLSSIHDGAGGLLGLPRSFAT